MARNNNTAGLSRNACRRARACSERTQEQRLLDVILGPDLEAHLVVSLSRYEAITEVSSSTWSGSLLARFNSGNDFKTIAALIDSLVREYKNGPATESGLSGESTARAGLKVPLPFLISSYRQIHTKIRYSPHFLSWGFC
jgi:hypothetical protein